MAQHQGDLERATRLLTESLVLYKEMADKSGIAAAMEGFACGASSSSQWRRAAKLFGAAEALRQAIGAPLPPPQKPEYDRSRAIVRDTLGDEVFAAARAEGQAMVPEQAVEYALKQDV